MFLLRAGWWKKFLYKERNDMYRKYYQCANRRHKSSKNSAGKRFTFYKCNMNMNSTKIAKLSNILDPTK